MSIIAVELPSNPFLGLYSIGVEFVCNNSSSTNSGLFEFYLLLFSFSTFSIES